MEGIGGPDEGPGKAWLSEEAELWSAEERKEHITLRESKAIALFLGPGVGVDVKHDDGRRVRLWIDNPGAQRVIQKMTSKSKSTIFELSLTDVVGQARHHAGPHWPDNFFADRLSQTWNPGHLQIYIWYAARCCAHTRMSA